MAQVEIFNPEALGKPAAPYSHIATAGAGAKLVVVAGQVAIDGAGKLVGEGDIEQQAAQVFENLGEALRAAGADWKNVVQFMSFLTRRQDIAGFAAYRQREFSSLYPSGAFPPNTLLIVSGLADERWLVEVQAVAAV
jgi:enamine deaminase RidA (YjgF/YER057c/UK114 family)